MRHMKSGRKLSRRREHRVAMLANLAASIIKHGRVRTTDAKAKEVRPFLERLVTFARRGDLHARRIVLSRLKGDRDAVAKLFDEIAPKYTSRPGGYTRILKLGFRQGDNSPISLIEFVEEEMQKKSSKKSKPKKAKAAPKKEAAPAEKATEAPVENAEAAEETAAEAQDAPAEEAAPATDAEEAAAPEENAAEAKPEEKKDEQ